MLPYVKKPTNTIHIGICAMMPIWAFATNASDGTNEAHCAASVMLQVVKPTTLESYKAYTGIIPKTRFAILTSWC